MTTATRGGEQTMNTTIKRLPARAEKGRSITKDGRFFMWRDSLYSNSEAYNPLTAPSIVGPVTIGGKEREGA